MTGLVRKYWFLLGLALVFAATMLDSTGSLADAGTMLSSYRGPDAVIFLVFLFSGMLLEPGQIRAGVKDVSGTATALVLIFVIAPLLAGPAAALPVDTGVAIGLFLVAVMPTTLSSGVVMSGAAGGNPAHALFITIAANLLCMFTIPATLPLLLGLMELSAGDIMFDRSAVMFKIGLYVLVPLCTGMVLKSKAPAFFRTAGPRLQTANQCLILCIVWMGVSRAAAVLTGNWHAMVSTAGITAVFHALMLACAFLAVRILSVPRGKMEPIIFMGTQKTLPLSIILQVTLFPQYGQALMVCVLHHLVSLFMDGFLVGRLGRACTDQGAEPAK